MNEANEVVGEEQVIDDSSNPFEEPIQQEYQGDVPASQSLENETYQVNWESEAKKFQSMHDKQASENEKMRGDMKYLAQQFVETQKAASVNQQNSQSKSLSEEEFNPWDAYYKPDSESYKFRVKQEQTSVNQAVQSQMSGLQEQMMLNNTVSELKSGHKMSDAEVDNFMKWSTNPTSNLSLDTLINVWRSETGGNKLSTDSLGAVQAAKETPRTVGAVQGQPASSPKSEKDQMWDAIVSAGSRNNVL
jgi:hypothetical protein